MIARGYALDLYCDSKPCKTARWPGDIASTQYVGETFGGCAKEARADGWRINKRKGTAFCPKCSGKPVEHCPDPKRLDSLV